MLNPLNLPKRPNWIKTSLEDIADLLDETKEVLRVEGAGLTIHHRENDVMRVQIAIADGRGEGLVLMLPQAFTEKNRAQRRADAAKARHYHH
ncbi:MAG: hypothetical protein H6907_20865 [Hyphomicrobiales bacterium]|nr:hypothetical protein [Hyphomicrobiales bacterium]MCP5374195.1 hypothetical protein [Hyphomicrobiales bacterium]